MAQLLRVVKAIVNAIVGEGEEAPDPDSNRWFSFTVRADLAGLGVKMLAAFNNYES